MARPEQLDAEAMSKEWQHSAAEHVALGEQALNDAEHWHRKGRHPLAQSCAQISQAHFAAASAYARHGRLDRTAFMGEVDDES